MPPDFGAQALRSGHRTPNADDSPRQRRESLTGNPDTLRWLGSASQPTDVLATVERNKAQRILNLESLAGIRVNPDGAWMKQIARNLTDPVDGFLRDATHLIHDADPLFTANFKAILRPPNYAKSEGVKCVKIPPRSPNCNAFAERFVKTIKYECLRHFVFFGQRHLRYVISEYMDHYHAERFHQGISSTLIKPTAVNDNAANGEIRCRSRLGGLLNFYYREAA
jgi:putative transposase